MPGHFDDDNPFRKSNDRGGFRIPTQADFLRAAFTHPSDLDNSVREQMIIARQIADPNFSPNRQAGFGSRLLGNPDDVGALNFKDPDVLARFENDLNPGGRALAVLTDPAEFAGPRFNSLLPKTTFDFAGSRAVTQDAFTGRINTQRLPAGRAPDIPFSELSKSFERRSILRFMSEQNQTGVQDFDLLEDLKLSAGDPAVSSKLLDQFEKKTTKFNALYEGAQIVYAAPISERFGATGASDLALGVGFYKVIDPTSVVRETELDNVQNLSKLTDRFQRIMIKIATGQALTETDRQNLVNQVTNILDLALVGYDSTLEKYTERAGILNVNPILVVHDVVSQLDRQRIEDRREVRITERDFFASERAFRKQNDDRIPSDEELFKFRKTWNPGGDN